MTGKVLMSQETTKKEAPPLVTREQIKAHEDQLLERVEVPEWGGAVMVKGLRGEERDEFENAATIRRRGPRGMVTTEPRTTGVRELLVVRVAVDANGQRMFEAQDVEWLKHKSAAALERIFAVGCRLSGLSTEDIQQLEEEQEGNS